MIAAMLLEMLGANRETIMDDYLKTNDAMREYFHISPGEPFPDTLDPAWTADERFLRAAWDAMGESYMRDALGIDESAVSAFREKALG